MKFEAPSRISAETVREAPQWFLQNVLLPLGQFMEAVSNAIKSLPDRKTVSLKFTHGAAQALASPGFVVAHVWGTYAEGQGISAVKWAPLQSGEISVTVYFQSGAGTAICRIRMESE